MDSLDPRKFLLLRQAQRTRSSVAKFEDINLDGLIALQHRRRNQQGNQQGQPQGNQQGNQQGNKKATAEIHFLPLPKRLAQLLPQEQTAPKQQNPSEAASRAEFDAFKQEVDAKIDLRNAEMITLRARVLAMQSDIALIRKSMLRIKRLTVAGSLFLLCGFVLFWTMSVSFFL